MSLKKTISNLRFEKEYLEESKVEAHIKIETLEIEKKGLTSKCEDLEKMVLKFSKGQNNLEKLLGSQRMSFNKEGIGYNPFNKKKTYKNFFVQEAYKHVPHTTCNYCSRKGHISHLCPLRKPNAKLFKFGYQKEQDHKT